MYFCPKCGSKTLSILKTATYIEDEQAFADTTFHCLGCDAKFQETFVYDLNLANHIIEELD